jgi:nucleoside phosphorylase
MSTTWKGQVDFGIITIREDEFEAVLQRFPEKIETVSFQHRRYRLRRLRLNSTQAYTIAIVRCIEQGNGEAQAAARDLLEDLAPSWLLVVGIGGGVPANEFSLGDVIVSTRIADFSVEAVLKDQSREYALAGGPLHRDAGKLAADIRAMVLDGELEGWNSLTAITVPHPPVLITDEMFYGDDDWRRDVRAKIERHFHGQPPRLPIVMTGSVASSDRLIKDTEILQVWLKITRQIQAVEMESAGVYRAVYGRDVPFLAIRGISDIVGFKRHPDWTTYACHTAAAFLLAFLRTGVIPPRSSKPAEPPGTTSAVTLRTHKPTDKELLGSLDEPSLQIAQFLFAQAAQVKRPPYNIPCSDIVRKLDALLSETGHLSPGEALALVVAICVPYFQFALRNASSTTQDDEQLIEQIVRLPGAPSHMKAALMPLAIEITLVARACVGFDLHSSTYEERSYRGMRLRLQLLGALHHLATILSLSRSQMLNW